MHILYHNGFSTHPLKSFSKRIRKELWTPQKPTILYLGNKPKFEGFPSQVLSVLIFKSHIQIWKGNFGCQFQIALVFHQYPDTDTDTLLKIHCNADTDTDSEHSKSLRFLTFLNIKNMNFSHCLR